MLASEEQWLLALSVMSLIGPKWDVDRLKKKGFFKKTEQVQKPLDMNLEGDSTYDSQVEAFLEIFDIDHREKYYLILDALLEGSNFAKDMARLMQIGKSMGKVDREKRQSFFVNGRLYLYDSFRVLMAYEFHWPKHGLRAYDIANGLMLLRIGRGLGYIEDDEIDNYCQKYYDVAKEIFKDWSSFGEAAELGRQVHCKYLSTIGTGKLLTGEKNYLSIAYYSIWKHMKVLGLT